MTSYTHMLKKFRACFIGVMLAAMCCTDLVSPPLTLSKGTLLRDAEIEDTLRLYLDPLLEKAGIPPKTVRLLLIYDQSINAFATFGPLIVIFSGLITRCESAKEVIGVLAHEIGHLQAGHLAPRIALMNDALMQMAVGTGIGTVLSILLANPLPLFLGAGLTSQIGVNRFLSFSRTQETEADMIAVTLLKGLNWPVDGLDRVFQRFEDDYGLLTEAQKSYRSTHPLPQERRERVQRKGNPGTTLPAAMEERFKRIKAKIIAYTCKPETITRNAFLMQVAQGAYASALQAYRQGKLKKAEEAFRNLLDKSPQNIYLMEELANIYLEQGKISEAAAILVNQTEAAHPLILILKGRILIKQNKISEAKNLFEKIIPLEPYNPTPFFYLSLISGRTNKLGEAAFYLAEFYMLNLKFKEAAAQIKRARLHIKEGHPLYVRMEDISLSLEKKKVLTKQKTDPKHPAT